MRVSRYLVLSSVAAVGITLGTSLPLKGIFESFSLARAANTGIVQDPPTKPKEEDPVPLGTTPREVPSPVAAPLLPGHFGSFFSPQINNHGHVAFLGRYANGTVGSFGQGIFVKSPEGKWEYLRDDEKATNVSDSLFSFGPFSLNDNDEIAVTAAFGTRPVLHDAQPGAPAAAPSKERNSGIFTKGPKGFTKLVSLGEEVPNMPSKFSSFSNPSMNTKGTIAFVAAYTDPDGRGLFLSENGKMRIMARSGQRITPKEPQVFSEHYYPSHINERGEVAFLSRVGVGAGIFILGANGIELIAIDGKPSPIPGAKYLGFGNRTPAINDRGDVVFSGFYDGPNAGRALFYKPVGQPVRLFLTTTDKTQKYSFTDVMNPEINNRGDVVFVGKLEGIRYGIFVKTAKGIEAIAITGELAAGLKPGEEFNNFAQQPQINDKGEVVFYAQVKNATVGVFIKDAKGLRPYVMRGEKLPYDLPNVK